MTNTTDTSAAIEQKPDTQQLYDACLRDAHKTQKAIDNAEDKAAKGWRSRLFKLAQQCGTFAEFEGYCKQAANNVKGDKPKVWTQTQSDIKAGWDTHGMNPADYDTLESFRREKIDRNKAKKKAERQESDSAPAYEIPAQLAAQVEGIEKLSAVCHESDFEAFAAVLEKAIADLLDIRDHKKAA